MHISLEINNVDALPAGTSTCYAARDRGFDIGRDACDWTLPDPDKFISGRHCEVRYEAGAFWLHDISRNGTFINGSSQRMTGPHRLGHGDRILIGRYVILVSIDEERATAGYRSYKSEQRDMPPATGRPLEFKDAPFFDPAQQRPGQRIPPHSPPLPSTRDEVLREIAIGAGISPELLQLRDPHEVAAEIGAVLRVVVEELTLLLKARAAAKMLAKSTQRTMISAADNNPLKFVPGTDDILEIMFARRRAGYLDARRSIEDAFRDLKTHEFATYAAMQAALSRLLDDLSPEAIGRKLPPTSFTSKKGQAWDAYVATWRTMEEAHENGMLDIYLAYFSEAYAKADKQK
ncbi:MULTISPECIES: type VI secretion system-associated FHA domain protein TagH [Mesorhizobium]|uniref:type VI secretion system-associated FHA domain protein TagH n=1 Tax=Mesorhizobium TaxID=68287 RepID=UPI0007A94645|nr:MULTISPECIES: type VI secretion system-associated FHA domain protein TagH [Mesorhizobium]AMX97687.1 type VI secretion protein [Mesorhizobium ciceri]MDF3233477.1 type VI secretion system-associated FHA domain protein TagH [Mesorhizobium sp. DSM 30133]RUU16098.1 type VI secretion system-associated FHA domain protein TagH [Mesorhizobium sp. Primo-B]RUU33750.1 type VI secretion system-associated FHA domain protein TagH [Mesorhizobium sp. Primo-A]RVB83217.1 type VI secretion system-associated FH